MTRQNFFFSFLFISFFLLPLISSTVFAGGPEVDPMSPNPSSQTNSLNQTTPASPQSNLTSTPITSASPNEMPVIGSNQLSSPISGTINKIEGNAVSVKTDRGTIVKTIPSDIPVTRNGSPVPLAAIKEDDRVTINKDIMGTPTAVLAKSEDHTKWWLLPLLTVLGLIGLAYYLRRRDNQPQVLVNRTPNNEPVKAPAADCFTYLISTAICFVRNLF